MKKFIFVTLLLLSNAYAGNKSSAFKIICMPMKPQIDQYNCIQSVRMYEYYDDNALGVCASMSANEDKIFCMESIGDTDFTKTETDLCTAMVSTAEKQDCLNSHGSVHNP